MRNLFFTILFIIGLSSISHAQIDYQKLDKYIEQAQKDWGIPGLAIAVVKDGKIVFIKGYGLRDVENNKPVDENSLFAIASNSKAFTTTSLAMMVDQGKLKWDDKVIDYLPWFRSYNSYVTANMSIRDLVTHRSGLGTFSGDVLWYKNDFSTKEVIEKSRFLTPKNGFRESFGYQNIMFSTAGMVLEEVSGKSWANFIEENFFDKLGMANSNTSITKLDFDQNVSYPYLVDSKGNITKIKYLGWDSCPAAAAINSSVADMSKWLIFQLNNGKIGEEQLVSENQIWEIRKLATPTPVSLRSAQFQPGKHFNGYGMGWNVFDYYGKKVIGHGGGSEGMISKVTMIPEENFGFVILTNSINSLPSALNNQILDWYFGINDKNWSELYLKGYKSSLVAEENRVAEMKKIIKKKAKLVRKKEEYIGSYKDDSFGNITVSLKGKNLYLKYDDSKELKGELKAYKDDIFAFEFENNPSLPMGTVQFFTDQENKIKSLEVNIPNPDFFFEEFHFHKID